MCRHDVDLVERFGASRAFAHAGADAFLHALLAKDMTTSLQSSILEVVGAYRAHDEVLIYVSKTGNDTNLNG